MSIHAILDESTLDRAVHRWDQIDLTWAELSAIPMRLKNKLREWRGIYFIFDTKDGMGYVGSAYGEDNILHRWDNYAKSGDGANKLLIGRDPTTFRFTIIQLVAPDLEGTEVIRLESPWKRRLHTYHPYGLNAN